MRSTSPAVKFPGLRVLRADGSPILLTFIYMIPGKTHLICLYPSTE